MKKLNGKVTDELNFYCGHSAFDLIKTFGSPLYVYNERILRKNCRELKNLVDYPNFSVNYSAKANNNLALLQIVCEEGLDVDAMSPGEIYIEQLAGFKSERIFYVSNNVSEEEMLFAIERDITTSVDSLQQLEQYARLIQKTGRKARLSARFNPGIGAGHHEKVVTGGKKTKFGINVEYIEDVKNILNQYGLKLSGINQHIGSLFMKDDDYLKSIDSLLGIAKHFPDLEFIDLGGGFGIPYRKQAGEARLDMKKLGESLSVYMHHFAKSYNKELKFKVEPGRYIPAESGVLLGTVYSIKQNYDKKYIGTDLGMNVLVRPSMYDAHHDIEVYRDCGADLLSAQVNTTETAQGNEDNDGCEAVTVVGNICESGDIMAKDRELPKIEIGDILAILDAGSYGYSMCSNYNNRLRPAEVLIRENGEVVLIRERDRLEDLKKGMKLL